MNWARAHEALVLATLITTAACGGDPAATGGAGGDGATDTTAVGGSAAGGGDGAGDAGGDGGTGATGGTGGTGGAGVGGMAEGGMGGAGGMGQGGSLPMICQPNETQPCYEGPSGTEGVGLCTGGTITCSADGTAWSACEGQVLPITEVCSALGDEDCDGTACSETVWSRVFAGSGDVSITDVAVSTNGDAVLVADFEGSVTIGAQTFTNPSTAPRMVVVRLAPTGDVLWATAIHGHAERGQVAIGSQQSILLAGTFTGNLDFGVGPSGVLAGPANSAQDVFVARLDASGVHQWSRYLTWHATSGGLDPTGTRVVQSLELGLGGEIYLGGHYTGHWGGICLPQCPAASSGYAVWIRKLNFAGLDVWSKRFDSPGAQLLISLDVGAAGVIAGGYFTGSIDIGGQSFTNGFPSGGDGWLTRFDTDGNPTWTQALGGSGHQAVQAVQWTPSRILVAGTFGGGNPFGLGPALGGSDVFLAALDGNGSAQWANHVAGNAQTSFASLQVVEEPVADAIYLAGSVEGAATIAGQAHDTGTTPTAFVAKYDAAGLGEWSRVFPTTGSGSYVSGSAISASARVVLVGGFAGGIDLGTSTYNVQGSYDGFAVELEP